MVTQSWIGNCLKIYTIPKNIKFIMEAMKNMKVELTAGEKTSVGVKSQKVIFQGDALSPLLFVKAMMPINYILRKCTWGYKLIESQENIIHLTYMNNIKLFTKILETLLKSIRHMKKIWHVR